MNIEYRTPNKECRMRKSIFLRNSKFLVRYSAVLLFLAAQSEAQEQEVVQTGTPAMLEAANGKKMKVFLQSLENESLTFQPFKSPKNMTVPSSKIKSLEFFPKYDAVAVEAAFNNSDYTGVLATLEPLLEPFAQYMPVENNLQASFVMMMKSQYGNGEFSKVRKSADLLLVNPLDPGLAMQGKVYKALAAIADGDFQTSEKLRSELENEAAKLYLKACTQRAQGQPKEAMQTVVGIVAEHGNDVEWLAPGELLSAHLYLDLAMTNSALNTARQVVSMYAGTHIAGDAQKLYTQLGGED